MASTFSQIYIQTVFAVSNGARRFGKGLKADSSTYVNKNRWVRGKFGWQEGYGAFSYGHSQLDTMIHYIQNQERHHTRRSFKQEYLNLLRKFDIAFEDKYVFDFVD